MEFICRLLVCSDFKANATFCFHGIGAVTKMVLIVSISFLKILRWFTLSKKKVTGIFFQVMVGLSTKVAPYAYCSKTHILFLLSLYTLPVNLINICPWQEVYLSWLQLSLKFQSHTKHDLLNLAISELISVVRLNLGPLYYACHYWAMNHPVIVGVNESSGHLKSCGYQGLSLSFSLSIFFFFFCRGRAQVEGCIYAPMQSCHRFVQ